MLQWTWSITLIKYKLQYLFVSYVENTALKNSRILSSDSSCAIICLCAIIIQHCPGWSPAIEFPTPCLCGLTEAAVEEQLQGGDVSIRKPVNTLPLSLIKCRSTPFALCNRPEWLPACWPSVPVFTTSLPVRVFTETSTLIGQGSRLVQGQGSKPVAYWANCSRPAEAPLGLTWVLSAHWEVHICNKGKFEVRTR